MQFILTTGWEDGIAKLTQRLVRDLAAGKKVLWLVSGGSNIPACVEVRGNISAKLSKGLSVMLADERYGKPTHKDSNGYQLMKAGFVSGNAQLLPVLETDLDFYATAQRYEAQTVQAFSAADSIIAQLGIGEDGHIAGILPNSVAASEKTALVSHHHCADFDRLTLTFPALARVTAVYAFAFGSNKKAALVALQKQSLSPREQPAQILKQLHEAYVYNDQVGDSV